MKTTQIINKVKEIALINWVELSTSKQETDYTIMIDDSVIEKIENTLISELETFFKYYSNVNLQVYLDESNVKCLTKWWVWCIPLSFQIV